MYSKTENTYNKVQHNAAAPLGQSTRCSGSRVHGVMSKRV
jgi:hypothetical protein